MSDRFSELQAQQEEFVRQRGWDQYHRPKNLAMALSVEAGELEEIYQWRPGTNSAEVAENEDVRERTQEELADVVIYAMSLATQLDIDLLDAVEEKLEQNEARFDPDDVQDFE